MQPPRFEFYDPHSPIYTSPRFLPPAKIVKCKVSDAIVSHGAYLEDCVVENAIIGLRSRIGKGVTIRVSCLPPVSKGNDVYSAATCKGSGMAVGNTVLSQPCRFSIGVGSSLMSCCLLQLPPSEKLTGGGTVLETCPATAWPAGLQPRIFPV